MYFIIRLTTKKQGGFFDESFENDFNRVADPVAAPELDFLPRLRESRLFCLQLGGIAHTRLDRTADPFFWSDGSKNLIDASETQALFPKKGAFSFFRMFL
jgi:hypothetical protein